MQRYLSPTLGVCLDFHNFLNPFTRITAILTVVCLFNSLILSVTVAGRDRKNRNKRGTMRQAAVPCASISGDACTGHYYNAGALPEYFFHEFDAA